MIHFLMYCPRLALRKKFPYSEFFWSVFSCICTTYREIRRISPYSVRMRELRTRKTLNIDTFRAVLHSATDILLAVFLKISGFLMLLRDKEEEP